MAVDMFFKIDGIKGESPDKKHPNEIDVLAWSWGMSQSGTFHGGSGGGAGKASVQDVSFTKYVDVASGPLMLHCCNGAHIPKAVLVVRKAGKDPLEYLTLTLEKCMVTSVSTGGSGGEDRLTENVTLNFAKVKVDYKQQSDKGDQKGGADFKWDIAANAPY